MKQTTTELLTSPLWREVREIYAKRGHPTTDEDFNDFVQRVDDGQLPDAIIANTTVQALDRFPDPVTPITLPRDVDVAVAPAVPAAPVVPDRTPFDILNALAHRFETQALPYGLHAAELRDAIAEIERLFLGRP